MRLDSQALFSDAQAITATAASTNVVELSKPNGKFTEVAFGKAVPLLIQVVEDFNNLTSLKVGIQTDDNAAFSSAKTLAEATLLLADLKAGAKFPIIEVPAGNEGYMRLYYTVTGTAPTTGKITAGIVDVVDNSFQDM